MSTPKTIVWTCDGFRRHVKGAEAAAHVGAMTEGRECPPVVRLPRVRAAIARIFGGAA